MFVLSLKKLNLSVTRRTHS